MFHRLPTARRRVLIVAIGLTITSAGAAARPATEPKTARVAAATNTVPIVEPTTTTTVTVPTPTAEEIAERTRPARASRADRRPALWPIVPTPTVLACIRGPWNGAPQESNGRYDAVSPNGLYFGAYQFDLITWPGATTRAGHPDWAGHNPIEAPPEIQDAAAAQLVSERGLIPWPRRDECATA